MKVLWHRVNETVEVDLENAKGAYRARPYYEDEYEQSIFCAGWTW